MRFVFPALAGVFAAVLAAVLIFPQAALASGPETRAGEWADGALTFSQKPLSRTPAGDAGASQRTYVSPVHRTDFPFNALVANWRTGGSRGAFGIEVRVSGDGNEWSEWYPVVEDDDFKDEAELKSGLMYSSLVAVTPSSYLQYRLLPESSTGVVPGFDMFKWIYLNSLAEGPAPKVTFTEEETPTEDGSVPPEASEGQDPGAPAVQVGNPSADYGIPIISRQEWGANESYRFNAGKPVWPVKYQVPEKVIIHHTVTGNFEANPAATVRAIYYYHAITRGWGDIGYNFLVDWKGNVYEGRFGGKNVIGGHASRFNPGSIGVSIMGDYTNTDITAESENALVRVIAAAGRGIDPEGRGYFINGDYPNIMGHRDVSATACPGDRLYARLPAIRGKVLASLGFTPQVSAEIVDVRFSPRTVVIGRPLRVDVVVKNTGTTTIGTQGPDPGYTYQEGQTFRTQKFAKITGKLRVAIDFTDNQDVSHPYRWGLGTALEPGQTVTVTGYIQLDHAQFKEYWVGLVWEYVKYIEDDKGKTLLQAIPLPTRPADAIVDDPNVIYFPETQHNLGYEFRKYWEENGGLMQFGYPKTESFTEISPADGKPYVVQYFERARFEYHPEFKGTPYEVLLGLLGNQLTAGRTFDKSPPFESTPDRYYYPETGHSLSMGFKYYWENNGALPIYGYPISEEVSEVNQADGQTYTVQYFERNRFEYHPEFAGTRYEVLLGLLGNEMLRSMGWLE